MRFESIYMSSDQLISYTQESRDSFAKLDKIVELYLLVSSKQTSPIEPETKMADEAHDHYIKAIYNIQLRKLAKLGGLITSSVLNKDPLAYSLAGRSLLENIATWRYFLVSKYAKVFPNNDMTDDEYFESLEKLIQISRHFIFGTRFDWDTWLAGDSAALEENYLSELKMKKKKQSPAANVDRVNAVNVLTCIQKLSEELPSFGTNYELFCDMIHPNVGSNMFICGITRDGKVSLDEMADIHLGEKFIDRTLKTLLDLTFGQVNELTKSHFSMLICSAPPNSLELKL